MVRTELWLVRIGLVAVLALLTMVGATREAQAAKYSVVQCGWGVGKEAGWGENASARYNHSALCVPPGSDVWGGVEIRTYTRPGAGSAAAATTGRWIWTAPPHTLITNVRGTWWHQLRNQFQHRLGGIQANGNFHLTHSSGSSRGMEAFAAGFGWGVQTFESRLICARAAPNRCDTNPSSSAMVRALTITLEENQAPAIGLSGSMFVPGWKRGVIDVAYWSADLGSGIRTAETLIDGARGGYSEHACEAILIGGVLHGRKMLPCSLHAGGSHPINTAGLSDGLHSFSTCVTDFAGNRRCTGPDHFHIDNHAPAAPVGLGAVGGEGWRRQSNFEFAWSNPAQGGASPITGATYRVTGPGGFDTGEMFQDGMGISGLPGPKLPTAGEYRVSVRLHDQAGHTSAANAASATLRFDDVPPEVGFRGFSEVGMPERIRARIVDGHSGPAGGSISYRRQGTTAWIELPAGLEATGRPGEADLVAKFPSDTLEPDRYEFRAVGRDAAGNSAESNQRIDGGGAMVADGPLKAATKLEAQLEAGGQVGNNLTAGFLDQPMVGGRLTEATGRPLGGRELRVAVTPEAGAKTALSRYKVTTGADGRFSFRLGHSTSRRIEVRFAGDARLAASRAPDLGLSVVAALTMRAKRKRVVTGTVLRLSGQVDMRDAKAPPEGKLVTVQYRDRRAKLWRPVVFVRSDSAGHFWARYRFRFITRPTRIRMRAVALPEALWPYAASVSKPFNVRVIPRRWKAKKRAARRRAAKKRAAKRRAARRAAKKRAARRAAMRGPARRAARRPTKARTRIKTAERAPSHGILNGHEGSQDFRRWPGIGTGGRSQSLADASRDR